MPNNHRKKGLPAGELRWRCPKNSLKVTTAEEVARVRRVIGQSRGIRALTLGMEMKRDGYNIFVTGYSGTGRLTTIKQFIAEMSKRDTKLRDHCYVHNFTNADQPILITLEAGRGRNLADSMLVLIEDLKKSIPESLDRKRYKDERRRTMEHFQQRQQSVLKDFEVKVKERGFEVIQVQMGPAVRPDITPVMNNQPVSFEQLESMMKEGQITRERIEELQKERTTLENQMELILRELRNIEKKAKDSLTELETRFVLPIVKECVDEVRQQFQPMTKKLEEYFDQIQESVMGELGRFKGPDEQAPPMPGGPSPEPDEFLEYQANVVVDNANTRGTPFIIERNPRFKNVFGTIERVIDRSGVWRTDFMQIRAGSLLQADGGYLVLNGQDLLLEQGVWPVLKRTLRYNLLEIQPVESGLFGATSALKPEPVNTDVKVIILGDANLYYMLYSLDDEFRRVFKVRAEFDTEMENNLDSIRQYVTFIGNVVAEESLAPFDDTAIQAVVEYGARLAGNQAKLSTRFNIISDVLHEANYWATKAGEKTVTKKFISRAIDERIERSRSVEYKLRELIATGDVMISTRGAVVGQVNGLTIYDMRDYQFGIPVRITARTAVGGEGVINIEREVDMSGPSHNKGVMILSGYLHGMYAQDKPLTMNSSITFEQSYTGVDGDSASSAEIYAIVSSLSGLPLSQEVAVTGSVNQMGEIQPVGGINHKIEGFFQICKANGFTGTQGVIIPVQNKDDLMLRSEVIDAVTAGKFSIWAIEHIDEGLEILTGVSAGKRNRRGGYPDKTVHGLADRRLAEFGKRWRDSKGG